MSYLTLLLNYVFLILLVNQKVNENDSSIPSPDVKSSTSSKPDVSICTYTFYANSAIHIV